MDLKKIIRKILKNNLGLKKNEKVLIITDKKQRKNADLFRKIAEKLSKETVLIQIKERKFDGEEPSKEVSKLMKKFDVILLLTTKSLTHTKATRSACKFRARIMSSPGLTRKMFFTGLSANYLKIDRETKKLAKKLKRFKKVKVTTKSGTDLSFSIKGRKWKASTGLLRNKGEYSNIPSGEVFIAPVEGTAKGILVVDSYGKKFKTPMKLYVKKGKVQRVEGKNKIKFNKMLRKIKNSRNMAEFGIGTNPKATLIGNILQDEKVKGTCHVAIGDNKGFGGKVESDLHLDGILLKPNVYMDEKLIMKKGKLVI